MTHNYGYFEPSAEQLAHERLAAAARAAEILALRPVFLDTETTGLSDTAEVVEICILDTDGVVILDTLVKPSRPIPPAATAIHGIADADVEAAPSYADLFPKIREALRGRVLCIYNADYDTRICQQSATAHGIYLAPHDPPTTSRVICVMELYARWWGDWDEVRADFRWQSLAAAAGQQGIPLPAGIHRARADAELARRVLLAIAGQPDAADLGWIGRLEERHLYLVTLRDGTREIGRYTADLVCPPKSGFALHGLRFVTLDGVADARPHDAEEGEA